MFDDLEFDWVAYGEFSGFKLLPGYHGPRPDDEDFIPYHGDPDRLDAPKKPGQVYAFRRGMLLFGVDLPGLAGLTTAAHTEADVDIAVAAVARTVELLRAAKLA
jgi:glutamate-1-semialdehyde 2,1-aminomutase